MNDLNNVILTGRVTRDVELKYTTSGTAVANFSIAVNEGIKQQDGRWEDVANFFEITLWGKQAETMSRFLTKGKQVTVQGRLKQQSWQSEDGSNRSKVTVNAQFIQLLSSPDGGTGDMMERREARAVTMEGQPPNVGPLHIENPSQQPPGTLHRLKVMTMPYRQSSSSMMTYNSEGDMHELQRDSIGCILQA